MADVSSIENQKADTKEADALRTATPYFSVVLPVFNEASNLPLLHERLTRVFQDMGHSYELLFVDDGSTDESYSKLLQLQDTDESVRILKFSRNFGHHIAITAGLDHTRGYVVVLMDSDLQDRPEEIPTLFEKLEEGYDVVYGIRQNKKFPLRKRLMSWAFKWVMSHVLKFEVTGGVFRMLRVSVVEAVRHCREKDRLVIGLISWSGFRQTGVDVEHGKRFSGTTKYSMRKQVQLALNALTAFSTFPLQLAAWFGVTFCVLSFLGFIAVLFQLLTSGQSNSWLFLLTIFSFFGGIQLLFLGIIAEYVGRVFNETRGRPLYIIEEIREHRSDSKNF